MNYKVLMIIPVLFLLVCLAYVLWLSSGPGLNLGIDLRGGTQISIESERTVSSVALESILEEYEAKVRVAKGITGYSILIDFSSEISPNDVLETLEEGGYTFEDYSVQSLSPALGEAFFGQAQIVLLVAFIFMAITVFIIFRIFIPSTYVILAAFADIIETLAISQFLGINLSLATFAALLLLLGYSVDTDILLTTRVLKSAEGHVKTRIRGAMKTGLTMIGTAVVALLALYIISGSSVITQIASVLVIGLVVDVVNTWATNAGLLRWYVERKVKT